MPSQAALFQKMFFSTFYRHFTERAQNFDYLTPFRFPSPAVIRLFLYQ